MADGFRYAGMVCRGFVVLEDLVDVQQFLFHVVFFLQEILEFYKMIYKSVQRPAEHQKENENSAACRESDQIMKYHGCIYYKVMSVSARRPPHRYVPGATGSPFIVLERTYRRADIVENLDLFQQIGGFEEVEDKFINPGNFDIPVFLNQFFLHVDDSGKTHAADVIAGDHVQNDTRRFRFKQLEELDPEQGNVFLQYVTVDINDGCSLFFLDFYLHCDLRRK
jgi:hypothetical protein